jgi:hypothetical protein
MWQIDRSSFKDAEKQFEIFIPDKDVRDICIKFLAEMIVYANGVDCTNWSINLDIQGKLIRFNTGQEYCISINKKSILIICLKDIIKTIDNRVVDIEFLGHDGKIGKKSRNLHEIPDCLENVPGSVGCIIMYENLKEYLPFIREANKEYIDFAMRNTIILPKMKNAHSSGMIEYLSEITGKKILNPFYKAIESQKLQEKYSREAIDMSDRELEEKILRSTKNPAKISIVSSQYERNPYISEYAKRQAKGICQVCHQPAPFLNRITGKPFLETHHINPLSQGGKDEINNVIALCPNCHRERHYG